MNYDHKFNDQSKIRPCVEISPELTGIYHDSVCVESTLDSNKPISNACEADAW